MSNSSARVLKGKGFWLALLAAAVLLALVGWMAVRPVQSAQHAVSVGSAAVAPGGTVTVDVTAQGSAAGLGAWDFSVTYNSALLTATGCTTSAPGATVEVCNPDAGGTGNTVRFVGASTAGVTGADAAAVTLGTITFDAGTTEGEATLTVTVADFADPANVDISAGLTTTDGTITITPVTPTITPTPTATEVPTDTPTPTATEVPKSVGDVNCSGGLPTIVDAQLIAQVVLGVIDVGDLGCPDNADVNGNGGVDIVDAQLIAQLVLGTITVWPPA